MSREISMLRFKIFTPLALVAGLLATFAAPATVHAQQAYAYQNVFDDNSSLVLTGLWAVDNTPAVPSGAPASGGTNLNYNDGGDYDNGSSNSGTARTATINLTCGCHAQMPFWRHCQTQTTGPPYRQWLPRTSTATSGAQRSHGELAGAGGAITCPAMSQWHQRVFNPMPAAALNIPIIVEFYFNTVDSAINNYQGWFVD